jgi:hypothetical protein
MDRAKPEATTSAAPRPREHRPAAQAGGAARGGRPAAPPARRNRLLGLVLAGIAALAFVTCVTLAVLVHYAETHHMLASL